MSYDLEITRRPVDRPEEEREPLDFQSAARYIASIPGIDGAGDEFVWDLATLAVTFYLAPARGALRSVGVEVKSRPAPRAAIRRDYAQVVQRVFELGARLSAAVVDAGLGRELDPSDPEAAVELYAGSENDDPAAAPEPAARDDEAEARFQRYVDQVPRLADELRDAVAANGGPADALDFSPESLRVLWSWLLGLPGEKVRALVDGIAAYLALCLLKNVPTARWELGHDPHPGWIDEGEPILVGLTLPLNPASFVAGLVRKALDQPGYPPQNPSDHPDALYRLYMRWTGQMDWA